MHVSHETSDQTRARLLGVLGQAEPLRVFTFHFPADADNSGFIGWLAGHLKAALGTSVLVVCGSNRRRGGVFDHWCVPERIGEAAIAEVHRLRALGR